MPDKARVLIAGAGIGGLTAALALLQRGFDVEVFEQADELRELGAGIQLGPNGSRILIALGLGAAMQRSRGGAGGQGGEALEHGRNLAAVRPRPGFARALRRTVLDGASRRLSSRAVARGGTRQARRHPPGLTLRRAAPIAATAPSWSSKTDERIEGDVVVGAEGIHSRLRAHLFDAAKPQFTGLMAWRGIVPAERLPASCAAPSAPTGMGPAATSSPIRCGAARCSTSWVWSSATTG